MALLDIFTVLIVDEHPEQIVVFLVFRVCVSKSAQYDVRAQVGLPPPPTVGKDDKYCSLSRTWRSFMKNVPRQNSSSRNWSFSSAGNISCCS